MSIYEQPPTDKRGMSCTTRHVAMRQCKKGSGFLITGLIHPPRNFHHHLPGAATELLWTNWVHFRAGLEKTEDEMHRMAMIFQYYDYVPQTILLMLVARASKETNHLWRETYVDDWDGLVLICDLLAITGIMFVSELRGWCPNHTS